MAAFPDIFTQKLPIYYFPLLLVVSLVGCPGRHFADPSDRNGNLEKFLPERAALGFLGARTRGGGC